jgi:hypothetical protein
VRGDDAMALVKRAAQGPIGDRAEEKDEATDGHGRSEAAPATMVIREVGDNVDRGGGSSSVGTLAVSTLAAGDALERSLSLDFASDFDHREAPEPSLLAGDASAHEVRMQQSPPLGRRASERTSGDGGSGGELDKASGAVAAKEASKAAAADAKKRKSAAQAAARKERLSELRAGGVGGKGAAAATSAAAQARKGFSGATPLPARSQSNMSAAKAASSSGFGGGGVYLKSPPERKPSLDALPTADRASKRPSSSARPAPADASRAAAKAPAERGPWPASRGRGTPLDKSTARSSIRTTWAAKGASGAALDMGPGASSKGSSSAAGAGAGSKTMVLSRSMSADSVGISSGAAASVLSEKKGKLQPRPSTILEEPHFSGSSPPSVDGKPMPPPPPPQSPPRMPKPDFNLGKPKQAPSQPPPPESDGKPASQRAASAHDDEPSAAPAPAPAPAPLELEVALNAKQKKTGTLKKRKKKGGAARLPPEEGAALPRPVESCLFTTLASLEDLSVFLAPSSGRVLDYMCRLRAVSPYDLSLYPHAPSPPPSPPPKPPPRSANGDEDNTEGEGGDDEEEEEEEEEELEEEELEEEGGDYDGGDEGGRDAAGRKGARRGSSRGGRRRGQSGCGAVARPALWLRRQITTEPETTVVWLGR